MEITMGCGTLRAALRAKMKEAPATEFLRALDELRPFEALLADAPVIGTVWERTERGDAFALRLGVYGPGNDAAERDFETRQTVLRVDVERAVGLPEIVAFGSDGRYFETRFGTGPVSGIVTTRLTAQHAALRARRNATTYVVEPCERTGGVLSPRLRIVAVGASSAKRAPRGRS